MVTLALSTSGDVCSVAVMREGLLWSERSFRHRMHLSERLIEYVDVALRDAEAVLSDVTALAVDLGPGSFTGVRIGVMTAKMWADVLPAPLYGVSALQAIAAAYQGAAEAALPLIPCRPGAVYTQLFDVASPEPQPLTDPLAASVGDLALLVAATGRRTVICCGPDLLRASAEALHALAAVEARLGTAEWPRAAHVAQLAAARMARGAQPEDPIALAPLYVSPPQITTPKERPGEPARV